MTQIILYINMWLETQYKVQSNLDKLGKDFYIDIHHKSKALIFNSSMYK